MLAVSYLFLIALWLSVNVLVVFALWVRATFPAKQEGVSSSELDTLSEAPIDPGVCVECDNTRPGAIEPGFCSYECYCRAMEVSAKEEN